MTLTTQSNAPSRLPLASAKGLISQKSHTIGKACLPNVPTQNSPFGCHHERVDDCAATLSTINAKTDCTAIRKSSSPLKCWLMLSTKWVRVVRAKFWRGENKSPHVVMPYRTTLKKP